MTSIGFIGGGKMAEAIIKGILSKRVFPESEIRISVSDIDKKRCEYYKSGILILDRKYPINADYNNKKIAKLSDVIVLAVKPQDIEKVVKEIEVDEGKLVISIAAGITLAFLEKAFPNKAIIRAMPNNPALVSAGITALAVGSKVKKEQLEQAREMFGSIGEVVEVKEKVMDAVTGLSGSGPAFVYMVIEAMEEAGKSLGIDKKIAEKLAIQTVLGSAKTILETGKSAKELRNMVTSPGGTTIEGLKVLEKRKFAEALGEAIRAAAEKSKKLSQ